MRKIDLYEALVLAGHSLQILNQSLILDSGMFDLNLALDQGFNGGVLPKQVVACRGVSSSLIIFKLRINYF